MKWDCKYNCFILTSQNIHPYKRWHCASFRNIDVTSKWQLPGEQECSTAYAGPEWLEPRQYSSEVSLSSGRCSMAPALPCALVQLHETGLPLFLRTISIAASVDFFSNCCVQEKQDGCCSWP